MSDTTEALRLIHVCLTDIREQLDDLQKDIANQARREEHRLEQAESRITVIEQRIGGLERSY